MKHHRPFYVVVSVFFPCLLIGLFTENVRAEADAEEYRANVARIERQILDTMYNLAMSRIPGYKQRTTEERGFPDPSGEGNPDPVRIDMRQGAIFETQRHLDTAIKGEGFFQCMDGKSGEIVYTRCGSFELTPGGTFCLVSGNVVRLLQPEITVPEETLSVEISDDGSVRARKSGQTELEMLGKIELATFCSPTRLKVLDERFFLETHFSGPPTSRDPGFDGAGVLKGRSLEGSNVNTPESLKELKRLKTIRKAFKKGRA
ncbi:MAG TPA: hypothetical protein DEB39_16265 [Planctomycetaceae bacterium]|nr:hypothetical protein [Planctomycetaceae bacterium]